MAPRKGGSGSTKRRTGSAAGVRAVLQGDGTGKKRPSSVEDLYGGGDSGNLLRSEYSTDKVYAWFQRRHSKSRKLIDSDGIYRTRDGEHEWKVPYGLKMALSVPLIHNQIVVRYPFTVVWFKDGKRYRKHVTSIIAGIDLIARRVQYVDDEACVIARVVGYYVPPKLRGKFPLKRGKKTYYWCPQCMTARRFKRTDTEIFVMRKEWNETKSRYEFMDRRVALMECRTCGCTNRHPRFRASNQPWETRKIKKGVRRVKKHKTRT